MSAAANPPQFFSSQDANLQDPCQYCHQPIPGAYYRIRSAMSCPGCAEKIRAAMAKHNSGAYPLAIVCGMGATLIGMFLNAAFFVFTGWIISLPALAVGWLVGTAVKKGAGGAGGRLYQITAAILTYVAISMSSLPVGMHYAREREAALWRARVVASQHSFPRPDTPMTPAQMQAREQDLAARQRVLEEEFSQVHTERRPFQRSFPPPYLPSAPASPPAKQNAIRPPASPPAPSRPVPQARVVQPRIRGGQPQILGAAVPRLSLLGFLGQFLWMTIASPFAFFWIKGVTLETSLNFFLLVIGMIFAWRITSGIELVIFGPFDAAVGAPVNALTLPTR